MILPSLCGRVDHAEKYCLGTSRTNASSYRGPDSGSYGSYADGFADVLPDICAN